MAVIPSVLGLRFVTVLKMFVSTRNRVTATHGRRENIRSKILIVFLGSHLTIVIECRGCNVIL